MSKKLTGGVDLFKTILIDEVTRLKTTPLECVLFVLVMILCISCDNTESEEWTDVSEEILSIENLTLFSSDPEPAGSITLERDVSFGDTDAVILGSLITHMDGAMTF